MAKPQPQPRSEPSALPIANPPPRRSNGNAIARFLMQRPLFLWGSAWAAMLVVGLVALNGLLNPASSKGQQSTDATIGASPASVSLDPNGGRIPLWLFGAIALSCTVGSMLLSQQFTRPVPPQRTAKRPKKVSPPPSSPQPSPKATKPEPLAPYVATEFPFPYSQPPLSRASHSQAPQAPQPSATPPTQRRTSSPQTQAASKPIAQPMAPAPAAVVPTDEQYPLDWGNASLADKLDLRKQRSVSSWLKGN